MSHDLSNPAGSTDQPFRLLDLPRELLVPIVRSYRSPVAYNNNGIVIYEGEINHERYRVLMDLCSTHRDILAFAQEELFMRLDIRSDERIDFLNRSIASSGRCKEYAGRAESIYLGEDVDPDGLMQSAAFNPRELCIMSTLKFSLLNRFQNLRRIHLYEAQLDEALLLPSLETYYAQHTIRITMDTSSDFKSANLPNLRRLTIATDGTVGQIYDSILPHLTHLFLSTLSVTDLQHLLPLSTSLQCLVILFKNYNEGLVKVLNQLSRMDVKELVVFYVIERQSSDNWQTDFELLEEFKKVLAVNDHLRRIEMRFKFWWSSARPSEDLCTRSLARWKGIREELRSICVSRKVKVIELTCDCAAIAGGEWVVIWNTELAGAPASF